MNSFPIVRPRRLRENETIRLLVRETELSPKDLIYPVFVAHGRGIEEEIAAMPGNFHYSIDRLLSHIEEWQELGLPGIILFGLPEHKDSQGTEAYAPEGIVQQAIREIKRHFPEFLVITDVCLCQYTDHGHCGLVQGQRILNDPTLDLLARTALSHAEAGADMVAPSDMMDGRVGAIRRALDDHGFNHIPILAYSAKYASAFYGPFREAAHSAPQFGDRRSYQMDPANAREALKEVALDLEEGADLVMVKPALAYLDVIRLVKEHFQVPVAAYNVSGEYSMIKAAAERGWIDGEKVMLEVLTAIKRAGADIILTYFAPELARLWKKGQWAR